MSGEEARRDRSDRTRMALLATGALAVVAAGILVGSVVSESSSKEELGHGISTISTQSAANRVPTLAGSGAIPPLTVTESAVEPSYSEPEEAADESAYEAPAETPVYEPSPSPSSSSAPEVTVGATE